MTEEIDRTWFEIATFFNILVLVLIITGFILGDAESRPFYAVCSLLEFVSICVYLGTTYKHRNSIFKKQ